MGGLTSVASAAMEALSVANTVMDQSKSAKAEYKKLQQNSDASLKDMQERGELEKQQIRINADMVETERKAALRRAIAKQRAQFGASGVGSSGGSSQAVLLGLFDESDEDRQKRESLNSIRTASIDQGIAQEQRINTLQLSQLRERNRLNNLTSQVGGFSSLGKLFD